MIIGQTFTKLEESKLKYKKNYDFLVVMVFYIEKLLNEFCEKLFLFMITNPGYIMDKIILKDSLWGL